jgi:hypothetical protein
VLSIDEIDEVRLRRPALGLPTDEAFADEVDVEGAGRNGFDALWLNVYGFDAVGGFGSNVLI